MQFFVVLFLTPWISVFSQDISGAHPSNQILDSLKNEGYILNYNHKNPEIEFTVSQAVKYLQKKYQLQNWKNVYDPFRQAMGQLIFNASNPPFDSTAHLLQKYPYDSLNISWDKFYIWEPVRVRIPANTVMPPDSVNKSGAQDTVRKPVDSLNVNNNKFPGQEHPFKPVTTLKDTSVMVVIDTLHEVTSPYPEFPFRHFSYPYQSDSIKIAINALLKYLEDRDSTIIYFTGKGNRPVPFWLNSKSDKYERYWLKNDLEMIQ